MFWGYGWIQIVVATLDQVYILLPSVDKDHIVIVYPYQKVSPSLKSVARAVPDTEMQMHACRPTQRG